MCVCNAAYIRSRTYGCDMSVVMHVHNIMHRCDIRSVMHVEDLFTVIYMRDKLL